MSTKKGLTLIEVLMVIAVLMLLAAIFLPTWMRPRRNYSPRNSCFNNVRQIGISLAVWAGDHDDKFPVQLSTNAGGTKELVGVQDAFVHFQVLSNELATPRILFCPADSERDQATNFTSDFSNSKLSYLLNVDAVQNDPSILLVGDRNLTNGTPTVHGLLTLTSNRPAGWTGKIHRNAGNIVFSDFSGQQLTTPGVRSALEVTNVAGNRLAMP